MKKCPRCSTKISIFEISERFYCSGCNRLLLSNSPEVLRFILITCGVITPIVWVVLGDNIIVAMLAELFLCALSMIIFYIFSLDIVSK